MVQKQYSEAYECARKIRSLIVQDYQTEIPEEEMIYLTVYIKRITTAEEE